MPSAQQLRACPTVHCALEGLEAVDLAFGLSVAPRQLNGVVDGMSLRRTRANRMIGMRSESIALSIHASSGADLLPRRMPLKRASPGVGESVRSLLQDIDFLTCRSVSRPRGLMHSAAAITGEIA